MRSHLFGAVYGILENKKFLHQEYHLCLLQRKDPLTSCLLQDSVTEVNAFINYCQ